MKNYAGCVALVVAALFLSARSEYAEAKRSSLSTLLRLPLEGSGLPAPPQQHVAPAATYGAGLALAATAPYAAALAALPTEALQRVRPRTVREAVQTLAECVPNGEYEARLRIAAFSSSSGTYTFAALLDCLGRGNSLAPGAAAPSGAAAPPPLPEEALVVPSLQDVHAALEDNSSARRHTAIAALAPASVPIDCWALAGALLEHQTFGGAAGGARAEPLAAPSSALVYSSGRLPRLQPHRGCGNHRNDERLQYGTVTGDGQDYTPLTAVNQMRILDALTDLPPDVVLLYDSPHQLLRREFGIGHSSAKDTSAKQGPVQRGLVSLSLIVAAMKDVSPFAAALKALRGRSTEEFRAQEHD
jgi:hypothetical protein